MKAFRKSKTASERKREKEARAKLKAKTPTNCVGGNSRIAFDKMRHTKRCRRRIAHNTVNDIGSRIMCE